MSEQATQTPEPVAPSAMQVAAEPPPLTEDIPEKYHVKNEAGELDIEQSARKVAKAYREAEKRIGSMGARPESPDKYDLKALGENIDAEALKEAPGIKQFLSKAHGKGYTNEQAMLAIQEFVHYGQELVKASDAMTDANGLAAMRTFWQDDAELRTNLANGLKVVEAFATKAGIEPDAVHAPFKATIDGKDVTFPPLANHPLFAKIMAAIGPEVGEARPVNAVQQMPAQTFAEQLATLKAHPAYNDPRHAEHQIIRSKVRQMYEQRYPEAA